MPIPDVFVCTSRSKPTQCGAFIFKFISILLDSNGNVVVEYKYDAWGNHLVLDANGVVVTDSNHIGNLNPFRYRSYYYDTETGLYYLKSRYYDPEIGRFLNIDDLSYLDPDTVNGLNLYAYCSNNPVMGYDPNGTWDWGRIWRGVVIGIAAIAAIAITAATFGSGSIVGGILIGATLGAAGSLFSQTVVHGLSFSEVDLWQVGLNAITGALCALPGIGLIEGAAIGGVSNVISSKLEGKSWRKSIYDGISGFAVGLVTGGILCGIGMKNISNLGKSNYASQKIFLNRTGIKSLSTFSPSINKTTTLLKYITSNTKLGVRIDLFIDAAGSTSKFVFDVIQTIFEAFLP